MVRTGTRKDHPTMAVVDLELSDDRGAGVGESDEPVAPVR